jgi:UDP-GlcNAc:undecaprenyl-phosphate GlcNAc-1-phosphate transferase
MVIYTVQAALFVAAYYLRYESDLTILAFVTTFFAVSITAMQLAARSGWRLHRAGAAVESPLSRMAAVLRQPRLLPRYAYLAIVAALIAYGAIIVLRTAALNDDIRVLIVALFVLSVVLLLILRAGPLHPIEKATLYVAATVLVYLDALVLPPPAHSISILTWSAVSLAGVATAVRLRLHRDRRFQVTPLDLIVLFMALVVPSLTRTFNLPHDGALTIAKLVILFYAIEVLLSRVEGRALWLRLAVASTLAGLALRSSMSF